MTSATRKPKSPLLTRLRRYCLSLPGTSEVGAWGHPNFRVAGRAFAVYEFYRGRPSIAVKSDLDLQEILIEDQRFFRTPYLGQHGWVSLWADQPLQWEMVKDLVMGSYRRVTPGPSSRRDRSGATPRGRKSRL